MSYHFKTARHLRDAADSAPDGSFLSHLHQDLDDPQLPDSHHPSSSSKEQETTGKDRGRGS